MFQVIARMIEVFLVKKKKIHKGWVGLQKKKSNKKIMKLKIFFLLLFFK